MKADQLYIGIDSGTQGTKGIVYSRELHKVLAEAYAEHNIIENSQGRREQDPAWWIEACSSVMKELLAADEVNSGHVCAIGVSGQQHGMIPLDKDNQVIRPAKLWCDTETSVQCDIITKAVGGPDRVLDLIGNVVAAGFTASKILWMKQEEPEAYERLASVLLPHDYINLWLTGEKRTEYGDASGTAYFNVSARKWSLEILDAIDPSGKLEACLPELIPPEAPHGVIQPAIARQFGLPETTLVSSGGGDNMMGAIGTGNVAPGVVTTSLGTSGTIYAFSESPVIDRGGELAAFCSSSGGWLPLVCTMNVTVSTELIRDLLNLGIDDLNQKAGSAEPGAQGITLLPYFNGERTPALPKARASFHGLTSANLTAENVCRAAMEGATMGLRYGLDVLKQRGVEPSEIRLVGGGAKSVLWRQMVADLFKCPVICPANTEAGALGAAVQSMWCHLTTQGEDVSLKDLTDQHIEMDAKTRTLPDDKTSSLYDDVYDRYLELDKAMRPINLCAGYCK